MASLAFFDEGVAKVMKDGKWIMIDKTGKKLPMPNK